MNKNNKFKNFFSKFKTKEKEQNDVEEETNDTDYTTGDMSELVNEKQKQDLANNVADNSKMLNDLSLHELELLEKELDFKYDFDDYNILAIQRNKEFVDVKCELVNIATMDKKIVNQRIQCKAVKDDWDF